MNYREPQLQARLAADYVSGTMRGAARRRFESLMAADATLRREVREWEDEIYPLAMSLPPQTPPRRVWRAIHARIHNATPTSRWGFDGVYLWRLLSGALAVALIAGVALFPQQVDRAAHAQLLAVLQNPQANAMLLVRADSNGALHVRALEDLTSVAGTRALELWALPPEGKPQSLGLVAITGATTLTRPSGLAGVDKLAITLEPPGGSTTGQPTGPIIMSGKVLEI